MEKVLVLILSAILVFAIFSGVIADDIRADNARLLEPFDADGIYCSLSIDKNEYVPGESMRITYKLECKSNPRKIYNPFFNSLLKAPGCFRIFNEYGYLTERYLDYQSDSRKSPSESNWTFLHVNNFLGSTINKRLLIEPFVFRPMRPGHYKVQLVLLNSLLLGDIPDSTNTNYSLDDYYKIIAASEPISFTIVDKDKE